MYKWLGLFFILCSWNNLGKCQQNEFFTKRNKFSVSFQFIGNLMVIPLELNNSRKLNFIVDTGTRYTILTDLSTISELDIQKGKLISIGGLGHGYSYTAYDSKGNTLKLGPAINKDVRIIILMDSPLDLSAKMGIPIHGIIGFDAFKDFVVKINYKSKKITFYQHAFFSGKKQRRLRKHKKIKLEFNEGKPYLNTEICLTEEPFVHAKLLVDTGGWDAVWLFENSNSEFDIPENNFQDTLGYGLNGSITGLRTKINKLRMNDFTIRKPTTSFPDSLSTKYVTRFKNRNGSIGSEILKRFHVVFDYKNKELWLKPNKNFNKPFHYNMAGLNVVKPFISLPFYEVSSVVYNSPAYKSGLRKGDFILSINGYSPNKISLAEIYDLFHTSPGRKVRIEYERNGVKGKTEFILKDIL